ncbi:ABC transporter ATP-binding protein [Hoeflea prorocentri]|uniref:ATP-binding cassette domain-containing protein n=1 Tax=Hoeflea prorocentri TaxID=1922333 RepID=A0A9X3UMH2_9HYPH|nr:oligopeptide/dipeptide ABC transporter ATP-binding protein [Hoeflea prorocentri]MCY6381904.1 ATP-binding cassette domain-containing protein [Hoeflea prorocentri]MDA5399704.1 ATP-binding cassette domain-containing protein [Hoeflea prorocentri]
MSKGPVLQIKNLRKVFGGKIHAVDGVDLEVRQRETLALVGESGCGKSTVARLALRLTAPTEGTIAFEGTDITGFSQWKLKPIRRKLQFVFQDPYSSLDPRVTAGASVTEPLFVHGLVGLGAKRRQKAGELMEKVGLSSKHVDQWPRQFSGGQRQRLGIIRAFSMEPRLIIADEPVSALDVSVRSQVINLLQDLQETVGTAYLFISHDMATVKHIADRIAVMYLGRIMESAPKEVFFKVPHHPYSQALLSAVPSSHPLRKRKRFVLPGDPPSPAKTLSGCRFHPRCPMAVERCRSDVPQLRDVGDDHQVACHFAAPNPLGAGERSADSKLDVP